ncbi:MAG: hypothetical protein JWM50_1823 [Microbacteriaceae bacterium]|jgi:hypothetical protein|nr:hypothetical protein [Microbacteriaceae bacterium]
MMLAVYLGLLDSSERSLADSFRTVAVGHGAEPDVFHTCQMLAAQCDAHRAALEPVIARYGEDADAEPDRLHAAEFGETRSGPVGLLRDLQDVYLFASLVDITWTMIKQAALGLRDSELVEVVTGCEGQTRIQLSWLSTRMRQAAPQALIMAES